MATIKAILNKQFQAEDGTYQIVIRIHHGTKRRYFATDYRATESHWNEAAESVKKTYPDYHKVNREIQDMLDVAKAYNRTSRNAGTPFNFNQIFPKNKLDGCFSDYMKTMQDALLEDHYDNYCKIRTARNQLIRCLFNLGIDDEIISAKHKVFYTDITKEVILKLDDYLKGFGNSPISRRAKFATWKSCWKKAITWNDAPKDNPFVLYEGEKGKEKKREWLTLPEVRQIQNYVPQGVWIQRKQKQWAADMVLVSYYCRGIRFQNVLFMKKEDIKGGLINFINVKGDKEATSILNTVLEKIFARNATLRPNSEYFFIENPKRSDNKSLNELKSNQNYNANKALKKVMQDLSITKNISFHCARHTFSNNLLLINKPVKEIQDLLLHSKVSTTEKYLEGFKQNRLHGTLRDLYKLTEDAEEVKQIAV